MARAKRELKTGLPAIRPVVARTPELAERILGYMAEGYSMQQLEREPGMPNRRSIYRWTAEDRDFCRRYLEARSAGTLALYDECQDIADDDGHDVEEKTLSDGKVVVVTNSMRVQRDKLRIDTRKWQMSKMAPALFGENSTVRHLGHQEQSEAEITRDMTPKEAADAYADWMRRRRVTS